jgi:hypothetical protein
LWVNHVASVRPRPRRNVYFHLESDGRIRLLLTFGRGSKVATSEEVRKLKIELAEMQTTLAELRQVLASERAKVLDKPAPLQRRVN